MMGAGTNTQGVVLCNQVRMLDFKKRNAKVMEAAPEIVMDNVLARVRALLE
ncbi:MAG: type II toxin-antitoxin system PemK/MazF family toxin [Pseudomonadota bacterium]